MKSRLSGASAPAVRAAAGRSTATLPRQAAAWATAALIIAAGGLAAHAQDLLERTEAFRKWSVFENKTAAQPSCFAVTSPVAERLSRPGASRGDAFLYASFFPNIDSGAAVVNVRLGYPADPQRPITLTVDRRKFDLFVEDDLAWLESPDLDAEAIAAMRRGATAVVVATSTRGTTVTDEYSLIGFTAAVNRARELCR